MGRGVGVAYLYKLGRRPHRILGPTLRHCRSITFNQPLYGFKVASPFCHTERHTYTSGEAGLQEREGE